MNLKVKVVESLNDLDHMVTTIPIFSDIESGGLYIDMRFLQVYQPETDKDTVYFIDTDITNIEDIYRWTEDKWMVYYNSAYDLGTMNCIPAKLDDLLFAVKTAYPEFSSLNSNKPYSLDKTIVNMGFGNLYAGIDKSSMQKLGFLPGAYISHDQYTYGALDVYALSLIWEDKRVQDVIQTNTAYKVDIISQQYAIIYQQNGMPVHKEVIAKEIDKKQIEVTNYQEQIQNYVKEQYIQADEERSDELIYTSKWKGKMFNHQWTKLEIFEFLYTKKYNINSWQHTRLLFQSTESDAPFLLRQAGDGNPIANDILFCRRTTKQMEYCKSVNQFDKMITKFGVAGAITGRFTASGGDIPNGFNSQQIPRQLKHIFGVPKESEYVIIGADYATLELRIAASIYKEENMYNKLLDGADLHAETAKDMIGHDDFTKNDRQNAKPVNFGYTFGMGNATFIEMAFNDYGLIISDEKAAEFKHKFFTANPTILAYHKKAWEDVKKGGYIYETALGRRVMPQRGTDAINGPVQGTGGETTKLALHYTIKEDEGALSRIINVVHDSVGMLVLKSEARYWAELLERNMIKAWVEISKCDIMYFKDIPMKADVYYNYTYNEPKDPEAFIKEYEDEQVS